MASGPQIYAFGPFSLDRGEHLLLRDGQPIRLTPKAFELLCRLVENRGRILTKDELLQQVWPDTVVEETTLSKNIFLLRKALNENGGQTYIETIPKIGYRFVAEVHAVAASMPEPPQATDAPSSTALVRRWPRWTGLAPYFAAGISLLLLIAIVVSRRARETSGSKAASTQRHMLLVLPFKNLAGGAAQDYFADGLTEELITQVGRIDPRRLAVIGRMSAMQYKNSDKPLKEIAEELGAAYVLNGAVQRDADRVHISVHLLTPADGAELWATSLDCKVTDILDIESEVARAVAKQIDTSVPAALATEARASKVNPVAYDLYLKGRYLWNKRTAGDLQKSIIYFQQAIDLDSDYAPAYAGLADCYGLQIFYSASQGSPVFQLAKQAAQRALALDDDSVEAHTSLGFILLWSDWDWVGAEREYRRALEINPGYATAHQYYAEYLRLTGHQRESIEESKRALELDPLSPIIAQEMALPYYYMGDEAAAIHQLKAVLDLEPDFSAGHAQLGWVYEQGGRYGDAIAEYQAATRDMPAPWVLGGLGQVYAESGRIAQAKRVLAALRRRDSASDKYAIALVYRGLGKRDAAVYWLNRAAQEHEWGVLTLGVDPKWKSYRDYPAFQEILDNVGAPAVTHAGG